MDSLDTVEAVVTFEEIFGTDLPTDHETFENQNDFIDWMEIHLRYQTPSKAAVEHLKRIAKDQQRPELIEGLDGPWRREQIAAIIHDLSQE